MSNTDDMTAPVNNAGLEILGRLLSGMAATERFVLSFYADGSKPYAHTVHNLNASNVLSQIKDSMGPNISPDGELRNSDSSLLYHLRTTTSLTHWVLVRQPDVKIEATPTHEQAFIVDDESGCEECRFCGWMAEFPESLLVRHMVLGPADPSTNTRACTACHDLAVEMERENS